ncbi:MAG TPA: helix-turn-helix transcriptional regulator [Pseudomonadales bacterium]|nr:helix-turn-helix transcriptional regulator [Pseudomonadales bacterium]
MHRVIGYYLPLVPQAGKTTGMVRKDFNAVEEWPKIARQATYNTRQLANLLEVCPRQVRRYTRKLFNSSPRQWLNEQRLTDAALMLENNKLVKTIAFDLGFKTVSHFSHAFKSRYGASPLEFKKQKNSGASVPITQMSATGNSLALPAKPNRD